MTADRSSGRLDPRLTPARRDLAAAYLRGQVDADQFVEGESFTVLAETLDVKRRPRPDAPTDTQFLYGEPVRVFDEEDGWGWAQAHRDGYVGYVAMRALGRAVAPATHRVIVNRTFVYPAADMKQPPVAALPLEGRVAVEGVQGGFVKIHGRGFVFAAHVAPLSQTAADFVCVAERLVGTPYLWGGKSAQGIDCSGLVQLACAAAGRDMPRDTDMQETIGAVVSLDEGADCRRGDLVFWRGHVGIMLDASNLLHANAHHMLVACESLEVARQRILAAGSEISVVKRLS